MTVFPDEAKLQLDHFSTKESQVQEIVKNVQKVDWTGAIESIGDHVYIRAVREEGGRLLRVQLYKTHSFRKWRDPRVSSISIHFPLFPD